MLYIYICMYIYIYIHTFIGCYAQTMFLPYRGLKQEAVRSPPPAQDVDDPNHPTDPTAHHEDRIEWACVEFSPNGEPGSEHRVWFSADESGSLMAHVSDATYSYVT